MADATTSGRPVSLPSAAPPKHDWAAQAADSVVNLVDSVRDRTTGPALTTVRGVVYGTFAGIIGIAALVVFIIGAVRVLDVYLPSAVFGDEHVWVVYLILGLAFSVAGGVSWRRRKSPTWTVPSGGGEERPA
jgi:apolipoprotein N-acyltransferase